MRPLLGFVLALVIGSAASPGAADVLRERCAWTGASSVPGADDVAATPAVVDLDGDGDAEIAFIAHDSSRTGLGLVVAVDGQCRTLFETVDPGCRACVGDTACHDLDARGDGVIVQPYGLAAGDLDGDGRPEIIGVLAGDTMGQPPQRIVVFDAGGSFLWCSEAIPPPPHLSPGPLFEGVPALADLDGDGRPEIVVGSAIFSADGRVLAVNHALRRHVPSVPVDVDGDGTMEVAVGQHLMRADGSAAWRRDDLTGFVPAAAVADLDTDGGPDIVLSHDGTEEILVLDGVTGSTRAAVSLTPDNPACASDSGSPAIGDVDGDGAPEIVVATGSWLCLVDHDAGPPEILRRAWCEPVGTCGARWMTPSLADLDGDGRMEILVRDDAVLRVFDGSGALLQEMQSSSLSAWESVVTADVDGDCAGEVVVVADDFMGGTHHGVRIFEGDDAPLPAHRPLWNQNAYHVTNARDDGSIPERAAVPTSFRAQVIARPERTVTASPPSLWPPNHRMVRVALRDEAGVPVTATRVFQDEPLDGRGDGAFEPDAILDGDGVLLRAERSGRGDGRVYHVEVASGAGACATTSIVTVCVPHDQRGRRRAAAACVDQGALFDSTRR
jgi:hypothetical protein